MTIIIITLCITALELYALKQGIDGAILWGVIGTLAGIAGWQGKKKQVEKKREAWKEAFLKGVKCQKSSTN